jgi:hypothetical protein
MTKRKASKLCGVFAACVAVGIAAPAFADGDANAPASSSAEPRAPGELEAALTRYRDEPTVESVIRATIKAAEHDPARMEGLRTRARLRGLVPIVRLGVRRGMGQDLSGYSAVDGGPSTVSSDDNLTLQGWATFSLDRLMFAPEEISLERETRAERGARRELVRAVVSLYFERRRLQMERDLLGKADVIRELRIRELTALLNDFTNGAFLRIIRRR